MSFIVLLVAVLIATSVAYNTPGETFQASGYTKWDYKRVSGSKRAEVYVPFMDQNANQDYIKLFRLDLVGDAYARGFAHGALLTTEIIEFTGPKLDKYFADEVLNLDISGFPEPLQSILQVLKIKGAAVSFIY